MGERDRKGMARIKGLERIFFGFGSTIIRQRFMAIYIIYAADFISTFLNFCGFGVK